GQQRVVVQATEPDQPGRLLLGPHGHTAPGVGQIPGRLVVVGSAGAGDGGHGGGDALVVYGDLGGRVTMLAGPLVPVAEAGGLGQQGPPGRQGTARGGRRAAAG